MTRDPAQPTRDDTPTAIVRIDAAGLADADRSIRGPVSVWVECPIDPDGLDPDSPDPDSPDPASPDPDSPESQKPAPILLPAHPHDAGRCRVRRIGRTPAGGEANTASDSDLPAPSVVLDRAHAVLIPGLVNAHCHLDLTALGPRPHDPAAGFVEWVSMIIAERPQDPAAIRESVARGVALCRAGGVVAVGDIVGAAGGAPTTAGLSALAESTLEGVGFVEFFGIAVRTIRAASLLDDLAHELAAWPRGARIWPGLHPHAPNTVSVDLYEKAAAIAVRDGFAISTHLAESPEERAFVAEARGPQRELLEGLGIWDESERTHIGFGKSPVAHLARVLGNAPFLAAHVNDASDQDIATLARTKTAVAYCPRASAYFGAAAHFGPHRFRAMLEAGVNVCLGTDSIVNLDTPDRISPLDDARLLAHTTDTDARTLLAMMTTRGAAALGLDPDRYRFGEGTPIAGIVAVPIRDPGSEPAGSGSDRDPAAAVLASDRDPELLLC